MVVSRIQMISESSSSLSDAVTQGIKSVVSSMSCVDRTRILVDEMRAEASEPGRYCVSMRISVEALPGSR